MLHATRGVSAVLLCLSLRGLAGGGDRFWLARDGRPCATIVRGKDDDYAAERFAQSVCEKAEAELPVIQAGAGGLPEEGAVVLIGSKGSNAELARLARASALDLEPSGLTEQGYVAKTLDHDGRRWLVLAGGGRDGAIHAVADAVNWHLEADDSGAWLQGLDLREIPRFKYRWFWTWDHRMDWGGPGRVGQLMGGGGTYSKQPEAFLIDYKRCVDYMADHKFNGLIIWGFLRDTHGGVEASRELCRYAARRGVRILPGVGTSGYAGYYFEGAHPYNAATWLEDRPELCSIDRNGRRRIAPCPSKRENQDWLDEGARWLFENFAIGGVNLEMGDFFVCHCEGCKKARAAIDSDEAEYYKDMAISHMVTLKTMRQLNPNAWLSYATYTGYTREMMDARPKFLAMIPESALCQWTLTRMARRWPEDARPMAQHNIGYLHWCNRSTHTEDDFYLDRVQAICRQAAVAGFEGLDTYGELPDTRPNAEIFYLAWEAFLWNPGMTMEDFVDRRLGRLYGGREAARALLEIIPLVRTRKDRQQLDHFSEARQLAAAAKRAASPAGHRRWERLLAYLRRHERQLSEQIETRRRQEAAARAGRRIEVASVSASDEETSGRRYGAAAAAIDGKVEEPADWWLTPKVAPKQAWIELALHEPSKANRVVVFHHRDQGHYTSRDYTISARVGGQWKPVVEVKDNQTTGWIAHPFESITVDAVRLTITRSSHPDRMGVGELGVRYVPDAR